MKSHEQKAMGETEILAKRISTQRTKADGLVLDEIQEVGANWYAFQRPTVALGSSTVSRVEVFDKPDPEFKTRPVGFTAHIKPIEAEPLVWEGDGA